MTIGRSSPGPGDEPVNAPYRPVGVRWAVVSHKCDTTRRVGDGQLGGCRREAALRRRSQLDGRPRLSRAAPTGLGMAPRPPVAELPAARDGSPWAQSPTAGRSRSPQPSLDGMVHPRTRSHRWVPSRVTAGAERGHPRMRHEATRECRAGSPRVPSEATRGCGTKRPVGAERGRRGCGAGSPVGAVRAGGRVAEASPLCGRRERWGARWAGAGVGGWVRQACEGWASRFHLHQRVESLPSARSERHCHSFGHPSRAFACPGLAFARVGSRGQRTQVCCRLHSVASRQCCSQPQRERCHSGQGRHRHCRPDRGRSGVFGLPVSPGHPSPPCPARPPRRPWRRGGSPGAGWPLGGPLPLP